MAPSLDHRPSGTWRVRWMRDGHTHSLTFRTEAKAREWTALFQLVGPDRALRIALEDKPIGGPTTGEEIATFIETRTGITAGTRSDYRAILTDMERRGLARIPLAILSQPDIAHWINAMTSDGLSGKTIKNRHGLLSAALKVATRHGRIPDNPAEGMRLPVTRRDEMRFLTQREFAHALATITAHYQPMTIVLAGTGMRFGEASALTVADVDLTTPSIRVHQAWQWTNETARALGTTKGRRARTVDVPRAILPTLTTACHGRDPCAWLLPGVRGGPMLISAYARAWARACRDLTPPKPRVHDIRHSFAAWALSEGIPVTLLQRQLGHQSVKTTGDTYGHLIRASADPFATAVGPAFAGLPQLIASPPDRDVS